MFLTILTALEQGATLFVFLHGRVAFDHVEADEPTDSHEWEDATAHEILDRPDATTIVISQLLFVSPRTARVRRCCLPLAFAHAFLFGDDSSLPIERGGNSLPDFGCRLRNLGNSGVHCAGRAFLC